ncbi:MAG: tetratricopeptide repeat protein [Myxococcota bacterium]
MRRWPVFLFVALLAAQSFGPLPTTAQPNRRIERARALVEQNRTSAAIRLLERHLRRRPTDTDAATLLAGIALPRSATECLSPDRRTRAAELLGLLEAASVGPEHRIWPLAVAGDHREAIDRAASRAAPFDPDAAVLLAELAALSAARHDLSAAELALRNAHRVHSPRVELLVDLATVQLARGRTRLAVRTLRDALSRRPRDRAIRRELALALLADGRPRDALGICRALRGEGGNSDAGAVGLLYATAALDAGEIEEAIRAAEANLEERPDAAPALTLATAFLRANRREDAANAYRIALRREPENAQAAAGLAALGGSETP